MEIWDKTGCRSGTFRKARTAGFRLFSCGLSGRPDPDLCRAGEPGTGVVFSGFCESGGACRPADRPARAFALQHEAASAAGRDPGARVSGRDRRRSGRFFSAVERLLRGSSAFRSLASIRDPRHPAVCRGHFSSGSGACSGVLDAVHLVHAERPGGRENVFGAESAGTVLRQRNSSPDSVHSAGRMRPGGGHASKAGGGLR